VQEVGIRGEAAERQRLAAPEKAQQRVRREAPKRPAKTEYAKARVLIVITSSHQAATDNLCSASPK